jgi:PIN domain nuclease of toxin-antitoxin system
MISLLLDTHAIVWAFLDRKRLSAVALAALETANRQHDIVCFSAISVVEITYLIEKTRLPSEMKDRLLMEADNPSSNLRIVPLDREIADRIEQIPRDAVPDMPDRIIAATAVHLGVPLITRDAKLHRAQLKTIW